MSKGLLYVEYTILALSLAIMAIITFANVLSRFIFNFSFAFTQEVTVNLFVILTFVGASIGIYKGAHLGFDLIYDKLNKMSRAMVSIAIGVLIVFFFGVLAYHGIGIVMSQMDRQQITPALGWPQWVFTLGLPIGCVLCIIRTIESTMNSLRRSKDEDVNSL
ncbi:TRAP transporter small permease [Halobacillus ihumii]|uniref:TRAP transporter small permease n=1 Tax=Halobacillus ihumii TaxID=2686092 RepID=UPI0013D606F3|nr:TRAP transporter small permease [Halobacillus ihumii]